MIRMSRKWKWYLVCDHCAHRVWYRKTAYESIGRVVLRPDGQAVEVQYALCPECGANGPPVNKERAYSQCTFKWMRMRWVPNVKPRLWSCWTWYIRSSPGSGYMEVTDGKGDTTKFDGNILEEWKCDG